MPVGAAEPPVELESEPVRRCPMEPEPEPEPEPARALVGALVGVLVGAVDKELSSRHSTAILWLPVP